jgi:hypothetical protein
MTRVSRALIKKCVVLDSTATHAALLIGHVIYIHLTSQLLTSPKKLDRNCVIGQARGHVCACMMHTSCGQAGQMVVQPSSMRLHMPASYMRIQRLAVDDEGHGGMNMGHQRFPELCCSPLVVRFTAREQSNQKSHFVSAVGQRKIAEGEQLIGCVPATINQRRCYNCRCMHY